MVSILEYCKVTETLCRLWCSKSQFLPSYGSYLFSTANMPARKHIYAQGRRFRVCTSSSTFLRCLFSAHSGMESISRAETGREKYQAGNSFETKFSPDRKSRAAEKIGHRPLETLPPVSRKVPTPKRFSAQLTRTKTKKKAY